MKHRLFPIPLRTHDAVRGVRFWAKQYMANFVSYDNRENLGPRGPRILRHFFNTTKANDNLRTGSETKESVAKVFASGPKPGHNLQRGRGVAVRSSDRSRYSDR